MYRCARNITRPYRTHPTTLPKPLRLGEIWDVQCRVSGAREGSEANRLKVSGVHHQRSFTHWVQGRGPSRSKDVQQVIRAL